jgi:hypothetical protein
VGAGALAVIPRRPTTESKSMAASGSSGAVAPPVVKHRFGMVMKTNLMFGIVDSERKCSCGGKANKSGYHACLCLLLSDMKDYARTSLK